MMGFESSICNNGVLSIITHTVDVRKVFPGFVYNAGCVKLYCIKIVN